MLNGIFCCIALAAILIAAGTGRMEALTGAVFRDARAAVALALELIGVMALFLGLMRVAQDAGLLRIIARAVSPLTRRLFPTVPADHPAMSAMILNVGANVMGLGNAATPFGIKAMEELDRLSGERGTATDAMVLFLAINASGFAILPSSVIALRAAAGSADAAGIIVPTWVASGAATAAGVLAALALARLPRYRKSAPPPASPRPGEVVTEVAEEPPPVVPAGVFGRRLLTWAFWLVFLVFLVRHVGYSAEPLLAVARDVMSWWIIPALVAGMLLFGWSRRVPVYESLVEGAKDGFQVAVRIIPFLVAILVAIGMFRASGGMEWLVARLEPLTAPAGIPAAALPVALLRPLSGSGALGVMVEALKVHGPDSFIGYMVSTYQGSTETTFYVLALYFGAVGVKRTRHALPACLLADAAGICAATFIVHLLFGGNGST
jgi:spore maturation protein SpmA